MAGSPEASSSRIVSCGRKSASIQQSVSHPLGNYRAAVCSKDLVDQIGGVVVLVRSPGYHRVAVVFEQFQDFVHRAEDRGMRKYLL